MQSDKRLADVLECCHAADYIVTGLVIHSPGRTNKFVPQIAQLVLELRQSASDIVIANRFQGLP